MPNNEKRKVFKHFRKLYFHYRLRQIIVDSSGKDAYVEGFGSRSYAYIYIYKLKTNIYRVRFS